MLREAGRSVKLRLPGKASCDLPRLRRRRRLLFYAESVRVFYAEGVRSDFTLKAFANFSPGLERFANNPGTDKTPRSNPEGVNAAHA